MRPTESGNDEQKTHFGGKQNHDARYVVYTERSR